MEEEIQAGTNTRTYIDLGVIGVIVSILTIFHYTNYHYSVDYHILLQFGYYIPVIYAAMRFGLAAGIGCGLVITILFLPFILNYATINPAARYTQLVEIVLINGIGWLTGILIEQERKATRKYHKALHVQRQLVKKLKEEAKHRQHLEEEMKQTERLTALGYLSAGLAHEIRNPLGIIQITTQLLNQERSDDPVVAEYCRVLQTECGRFNRMVTDFLNFARPQEPVRQRLALGVILDEGLSLVQPILNKHDIRIERQTGKVDDCLVDVDLDQMKQVFLNIVLNAIETQQHGGKIDLKGMMLGNYVGFSVNDEGPGIASIHLPYIYDPFYTTKEQGTGLGLSIVHRILEQHGGKISIRNRPQRGAQVEILLQTATD